MSNPTDCPECGCPFTETVHVSWSADEVQRVMVCDDCPTEWTIEYADPLVKDVRTDD